MGPHRHEVPLGGSWEAERALFDRLAARVVAIQTLLRKRNRTPLLLRAFQAKTQLGVVNAELRVAPDIPADLRVGYYQPGLVYPTTVRVSNANGERRSDHARDMRSVALRVHVSPSQSHDLLVTNGPVNHARNAKQMVAFARALAGSRALLVPRVVLGVGPVEAVRMGLNLRRATRHAVTSLALETYWSRAPFLWGPHQSVRYLLRPASGAHAAPPVNAHDPNYLRTELSARLRQGPVEFDLLVQRFVDARRTPIEDGAAEWDEQVSVPVAVARLVIPGQDVDAADGRTHERYVEQLAFNPWYSPPEFQPLGNLNRSRKAIYAASADHRLGYRFVTDQPLRNRAIGALARRLFRVANVFVPWHRLGTRLGLLNLLAVRHDLRSYNLHDADVREEKPATGPVPEVAAEEARRTRLTDGTHNDLSVPSMGARDGAFGRNFPLQECLPRTDLLDTPDPITVARELLRRRTFIPARSLNVIAAAWIQFQVHDWVDHPRYGLAQEGAKVVRVPLPPGATWQNTAGGPHEAEMRIADNIAHQPGDAGRPPVFRNTGSHWWDGSQLYGRTTAEGRALRARDGERVLAELQLENGFLPEDRDPRLNGVRGIEQTGFNDNWWLGLSAMHTLFAREHNAVCAGLRAEYGRWSEERIYQTARLIVAALIAKIHTIEWTPAILGTKTLDQAMNANWSGAPRDWVSRLVTWLVDEQALKGIPETLPDHHTAPYSLTEEFVSVYRMHPLIPDDYLLVDHRTGGKLHDALTFDKIQGSETQGVMRRTGLTNALYSFGIVHPGAIALHNYPKSLQNFERANGEKLDLSVVDLVRDRRRGVPRYNQFRRLLRKPRVRHWEDITADRESARLMRDIYKDVEHVDTMVGLLAETPPEHFGFSDTAFRIFILMASRRLQSDRLFTIDFRPEVYSPFGMDWIARNGMTSVLLRHCPELAAVLPRGASAFAPWRAVAEPDATERTV